MDCGVLGELRVGDGAVVRTPRGQRSRDLFAVLLLRRGQALDAGVLLDQVWGDGGGLGTAVVHTQVARLRRDIGSDHVQRSDSGYRVSGLDVDSDRFGELVARAGGSGPREDSIALLREALALWRGDRPYADVTEELVAAESSRLLAQRGAACELLAERLLDRGDRDATEEAAGLAELLVARDPLRERGYELAMLAAARAGRRAEALEHYRRLRQILQDELGIDPGPAAQRLHLQVLRDELEPLGDAPPASPRTAVAPAPTSPTIGRDADLAQLQELLRTRRLVSIVGLGGVGKTRVLAELAMLLGPERVAGYVDLSALPERPGDELLEHMTETLGVAVQAGDPLAKLSAWLGDRQTVLLLDEAERCLGEVSAMAEVLLARCPGLRVVVASRRPLGLVEEAAFVLAPLATPSHWADVDAVAASPAVMMLRERIADRAPALVQGEEAVIRLASFARRVDGLPLALQLLAAQAPGRSLDDLEAFLDEPLTLGSEDAGVTRRHRTLQQTLGWSLDRLPEDEQRALRRLAVFAGRFAAPSAAAVVGGDIDGDAALRALVRDALIQVERTEAGLSYRLLRPVRDLAHADLVASGELEEVVRRHRRWHADRWRGALRSDALLYDVRDHYADYVAALRSAYEDADPDHVSVLTTALGRLWSFADMHGPGLRWYARAIDSGLLGPLERARLLRMRASLLLDHDPERVRADLAEAIPVFTEHDDLLNLAGAHSAAAIERSNGGALEDAVTHARLAVAAARHTTAERLADVLGVHAAVVAPVHPEEAEGTAREAWSIVTRSGSTAAVASVATNLSWAHLGAGRPKAAVDVIEHALRVLSEHEVPTFFRVGRGWALLANDDPAGALREFDRVVADSGDAEDRPLAEIYLGAACAVAQLGHHAAPELLAGAEAMVARSGRVLSDWQQTLVATAHSRAATIGTAPWGAGSASGAALAALLHDAAEADASAP